MHDPEPCPCNLCRSLADLLDRHREAIHQVERTRQEVEQAARQVDRRHHLPSAWDAPGKVDPK
jgi:hypothetical protein